MYHLLDHPNPHGPNYYTQRRTCRHGITGRPHLIVVHTAEVLPDFDPPDYAAERVVNYASTTTRSVSWHSTVDSDSIIPTLPDEYVGFHVKGFNTCSLGMEYGTQAAAWWKTPWEWREPTLLNGARQVADWCKKWDITVKHLTRAEVDEGWGGIVGHDVLDPDRRTDPGESFPWDWFIERVEEFRWEASDDPLTPEERRAVRRIITMHEGYDVKHN